MQSSISKLIELDQLARRDATNYPRKRLLYKTLRQLQGKHFCGIVGSRGAGKTVLLKQLAAAIENSFYLSLDAGAEHDLFDLAKHLQETMKIDTLLIDEIHFQSNYDAELKKIGAMTASMGALSGISSKGRSGGLTASYGVSKIGNAVGAPFSPFL